MIQGRPHLCITNYKLPFFYILYILLYSFYIFYLVGQFVCKAMHTIPYEHGTSWELQFVVRQHAAAVADGGGESLELI